MTERPRILAFLGGAVLLGQERGNMEALTALKQQGCEVLCLIRDEPWSVVIPPALDARGLEWVKVPYIEHRMPGRLHYVLFRNPIAFMCANWRLWRIVREFRPTHIHACNPLYVLNFVIGLLLLRIPMVYRAGDEPTMHNTVWRMLWKFVVWRTDRFVANSRFVAQSLRRKGVQPDRITVIYNAPTHREHALEPMHSNEPVAGRIAFVGQISEHKGVHVLVEALRQVADEFLDARLVIAGRISDWSGDAWARELRDTTMDDPVLSQRVDFIGEITDVPCLLAGSCIHTAPSLFEDPAPNVVVEAKQAGCPSIVFPRGGMPELVEHGVDGLVCPEPSALALAAALRIYLADPDLARRHGKAARASLARLGVPEFGQRWLDVYQTESQNGEASAANHAGSVPAKRALIR